MVKTSKAHFVSLKNLAKKPVFFLKLKKENTSKSQALDLRKNLLQLEKELLKKQELENNLG